MKTRFSHKPSSLIEGFFPEQRVFLKSDAGTRFIRLKSNMIAGILGGSALVIGWSVIVTAIFLMDAISTGNAREQAQKERTIYEARLNALSTERDNRAEESAAAQERFAAALNEVSKMQSALLDSEDGRKELGTGIEVIQTTLRKIIKERDEARSLNVSLSARLAADKQNDAPVLARAETLDGSVEFLADALEKTARERDERNEDAANAEAIADDLRFTIQLNEDRNEQIFTRLEDAVTVSLEPLDKMFSAAGMPTDRILEEVRRGYSGQGGPLLPATMSTSGGQVAKDPTSERANSILKELDRINLFRIAAEKSPVDIPVKSAFRYTSGFGYRNDPKGAGRRMHSGTDFAGAHGTPIYATGDGEVVHAGRGSGYGRLIKIRHRFGFETRYAHLSKIRVKVGQRVSRGDRIGDMGNSGRSTGTHLHYEVRMNGNAVNPMTYIKAGRDVF